MNKGIVIGLSACKYHSLQKFNTKEINLLEGLGVEGDVHMGKKVKHRSRVARNPDQPNLRQVHLLHTELHQELREKGFNVLAGQMGENIATSGINLLGLPEDSLLRIGDNAVIKVTGLRNPCNQLNGIKDGLMDAVLGRNTNGDLIRKAGIMAIVLVGGVVKLQDKIEVVLPDSPHRKLSPV